MFTLLGAITGVLAFVPLFLSLRAGKNVTSKSNFGYLAISLLGVFASILVLVVAVLLIYFLAYDNLLRFSLSAGITLIFCAIIFGVYSVVSRNRAAKERKQNIEEKEKNN